MPGTERIAGRPLRVMAGLVPALSRGTLPAEMARTSPAMTGMAPAAEECGGRAGAQARTRPSYPLAATSSHFAR